MINNNLFLQQDLVELPFEFADEDNSTMAHAFTTMALLCQHLLHEGAGMKITDIKIEMRDNTAHRRPRQPEICLFPDDNRHP